ncbi:BLUF domain-containing protein [Thaumasiovibrio subtropicus]|uniref:BLUF domain-containing protein n=1 Tax=Thaumasiovibrio subtropicus TaxID=1891207 RepID=UPI000B34EDDC|nr:BLUF domain-containing protein [Thaumasiovibrio subtropicus]
MQLVRLVYASKKTAEFLSHDLEAILRKSNTNNEHQNITGMLCFNRKFFLQCLEGSRTSVNRLYNKIANDPRHEDVMLLQYEEISERCFGDWMMSFLPESHLHRSLLLRFSINEDFNPYTMSAKSCFSLLHYVHEQLLDPQSDYYVDQHSEEKKAQT